MDRVISRSLDATVLGEDLMLVVFECHRASRLVEVVVQDMRKGQPLAAALCPRIRPCPQFRPRFLGADWSKVDCAAGRETLPSCHNCKFSSRQSLLRHI